MEKLKKERLKILIFFELCLLASIVIGSLSYLKNDTNTFQLSILWIIVNILYQIKFYKDFKEIFK